MQLTQIEVDRLYKKEFVTTKDAAALLGVTRQRVARLIKIGVFKTEDMRNKLWIPTSELLMYSMKRRRKLLEKANNILLPTIK